MTNRLRKSSASFSAECTVISSLRQDEAQAEIEKFATGRHGARYEHFFETKLPKLELSREAYRDRDGSRRLESTNTTDWDEAQRRLRERLVARDDNSLETLRKGKQLTFDEWADFFLVNYSKPPIRAPKTHEANENALKSLRPVFGSVKLVDIDATQIEFHLRARLQQKRRVRRRSGIFELGPLQATSVHQEFRVLRRIFSVAVKKKLILNNPCDAERTISTALHDVVGTD